jgi:hypothetical protein
MPKTKAGRLTPQIHQMKKDLEQKKDSLSATERRSLIHRLKRAQRKANLIQKEEDRLAAMAKKPKKAAAAEETTVAAAPAEVKVEDKVEAKPEEKAEVKVEDKVEAKPEEKAEVKVEDNAEKQEGDEKAEA